MEVAKVVSVIEHGETLECEVICVFDEKRALVIYRGTGAMADRLSFDEWELRSEPARPGEELSALNEFVKKMEAQDPTVTVTKS